MFARYYLFRIALLITVALAGVLPPIAAAGADAVASDAFGPQLFLVSPAAGQMAALAELPGVVHAALYAGGPERYLVSGPATLSLDAAAAGIPAELLDADTVGQVYYFVDAQAPDAADQSARFGRILYADAWQIVLAVPAEREADLLETLPAAGIGLALIPPEPLPLDQQPLAAAPAAASAAGDPAVAAMLGQVSATAISDAIADLSGERPAIIDGAYVTLATPSPQPSVTSRSIWRSATWRSACPSPMPTGPTAAIQGAT